MIVNNYDIILTVPLYTEFMCIIANCINMLIVEMNDIKTYEAKVIYIYNSVFEIIYLPNCMEQIQLRALWILTLLLPGPSARHTRRMPRPI